jgi:hypothetical protein
MKVFTIVFLLVLIYLLKTSFGVWFKDDISISKNKYYAIITVILFSIVLATLETGVLYALGKFMTFVFKVLV